MSLINKTYSFSQYSRYSTCPKSYRWYYVEKYRETSFTAFLPFGSAVDLALNAILGSIKDGVDMVDYKAVFDDAWTHPFINKQKLYLVDNVDVGYKADDMEVGLIYPNDFLFIKAKAAELVPEADGVTFEQLAEQLQLGLKQKKYKAFSKEHHRMLNILYWFSMRRKGHLMLEAYVRDIVPQIDEVVSTQQKISLTKPNGDSVIGYVDAVLRLKGHSEPVVVDNKTSARPYEQEDVADSPQLGQYCYALDLTKAAYAVMLKAIKLNKKKTCVICNKMTTTTHKTCNEPGATTKRCNGAFVEELDPIATTQLFVDVITPTMQESIIENIDEITQAIEAKVFPPNLNSCNNTYGGRCPFYNLCYNKSTEGLVKGS